MLAQLPYGLAANATVGSKPIPRTRGDNRQFNKTENENREMKQYAIWLGMNPPTVTAQQKRQVSKKGQPPKFFDTPALAELRAQLAGELSRVELPEMATCPLTVVVELVYHRPKMTPEDEYQPCSGKPDPDNVVKAILDACTKAKVWRDDSLITQLTILKLKHCDRRNVGIGILVAPSEGYQIPFTEIYGRVCRMNEPGGPMDAGSKFNRFNNATKARDEVGPVNTQGSHPNALARESRHVTQFRKVVQDEPLTCDVCGGLMLAMWGHGFDYDRVVCTTRDCGAEIQYPTSTEIPAGGAE